MFENIKQFKVQEGVRLTFGVKQLESVALLNIELSVNQAVFGMGPPPMDPQFGGGIPDWMMVFL